LLNHKTLNSDLLPPRQKTVKPGQTGAQKPQAKSSLQIAKELAETQAATVENQIQRRIDRNRGFLNKL
jgi:hypothetical protein